MTGKLITYENNCMSLSCKGEMKIVNNIITNICFKEYPRVYGDSWIRYYNNLKIKNRG